METNGHSMARNDSEKLILTYIGNHPWKNKFAYFVKFGSFVNVFLLLFSVCLIYNLNTCHLLESIFVVTMNTRINNFQFRIQYTILAAVYRDCFMNLYFFLL